MSIRRVLPFLALLGMEGAPRGEFLQRGRIPFPARILSQRQKRKRARQRKALRHA